MRTRALLLALGLLEAGCFSATTSVSFNAKLMPNTGRFVQTRIPLSESCYLVLVRDLRTETCFVAYGCGTTVVADLVVAPAEVCKP